MLMLSTEQVSQIVRGAKSVHRAVATLSERIDRQLLANSLGRRDERLSQSLLRGLAVFCTFPLTGDELTLQQAATLLGFGASTTHRYLVTLTEAGLLERDPITRRYRKVSIPTRPARRTLGPAQPNEMRGTR
jgi:Fic family protein